MSSLHIELCDVILSEIAAQSWTPPILVGRRYPNVLQQFTETERQSVQLSVVPATQRREQADRVKNFHLFAVWIVLQHWPAIADNAALDPMLALVESVNDFLMQPEKRRLALTAPYEALWVSADTDPLYDSDQLVKSGEFQSISIHLYQVLK